MKRTFYTPKIDFEYIYCVEPIDKPIGGYSMAEAIVETVRDEFPDQGRYLEERIISIIEECDFCKRYASEREDAAVGDPVICYMPDLSGQYSFDAFERVIVVKSSNNGTTYVFSHFPITDEATANNIDILKHPSIKEAET